MPVATSSGEELEHRVGSPGQHTALGDQLIWFALPLLRLSAALVWLDRRRRADRVDDGATTTPTTTLTTTATSTATTRRGYVLLRTVSALAVIAATRRVRPGLPGRRLRRSCRLGRSDVQLQHALSAPPVR